MAAAAGPADARGKRTVADSTQSVASQLRDALSRHDIARFSEMATGQVLTDAPVAELLEAALRRHEGRLSSTGSLVVQTLPYTGRVTKDRFIVDSPGVHGRVCWGKINQPMTEENFERLFRSVCSYLEGRELFINRGMAGADRAHARKVTVIAERASQALYAHQMMLRPTAQEMARYGRPDLVLIAVPDFVCVPARDGTRSAVCVAINLELGVIIVAGTGYSGEIKKSVFSAMNYFLPTQDNVLPMHCSANKDPQTGATAIFFGLSGTGKTTLSADPARALIGDDEHGWSANGIFNIEGGCYAKCINLDPGREPEIFNAVRFGSVSENVVLDAGRLARYEDDSLTENTRVAYPLEHIPGAALTGTGDVPEVLVFLTADAFGVLPAISRLSPEAAMYHFMTGFTSKVAGTEQGISEPQPTFSALFGEPFMPLDPLVYAEMLRERIYSQGTRVYLVNTGWTGGGYGVGQRFSLCITRALVRAALDGSLDEAGYVRDPVFNLDVPRAVPGIDACVLDQRGSWADPAAYDAAARHLADLFEQNFCRRYPDAPEEVHLAGPRPAVPRAEGPRPEGARPGQQED